MWGLVANSTAMMVGSSLYSTPVIVLLRVKIVRAYFWYACKAQRGGALMHASVQP